MSLLLMLGGFSLLLPYSINVNMDSPGFFLYHLMSAYLVYTVTNVKGIKLET